VFDVPTIAAHCIAINEEDMEVLAEKNVTVVQCPNCHMKFGMGVTPVPELLERGVNVALGTDGAGSNNNLDMLEEVRIAQLMQKQAKGDPTALPGDLPLRMATRNGATAMGFPQSGVLAPGMAADIILLDFNKPHLRPRHSLVGNVVHSAFGSDVDTVIVAGRVLMRDGELLTLDEERILYEAERHANRLVGQAKEMWRVREYKG
jgi:5-methylthioadenosine/S-adenosylhomocysteine deaminase